MNGSNVRFLDVVCNVQIKKQSVKHLCLEGMVLNIKVQFRQVEVLKVITQSRVVYIVELCDSCYVDPEF